MRAAAQDFCSRFIRVGDCRSDRFIFDLPRHWWSRPYEYDWASRFAASGDVALDAACGVCHPLKFFLCKNCAQTHGCDMDERILSDHAIRSEICEIFGEAAAAEFDDNYRGAVRYEKASLARLPYANCQFDKIYCISVLEHLDDARNPPASQGMAQRLKWLVRPPRGVLHTLREFRRVLKEDGLLLVTMDYPRVNLDYFQQAIRQADFEFAGETDLQLPPDALNLPEDGLFCFRAVLRPRVQKGHADGKKGW